MRMWRHTEEDTVKGLIAEPQKKIYREQNGEGFRNKRL